MGCVFCKVIKGDLPSKKEYEDENIVVINDINPVAKVHLLIIPKIHLEEFTDLLDDKLLGQIRKVLQKMIRDQKLMGKGYKIRIFGGGAQQVNHLHFHLTGPIGNLSKG